MKTSLVQRTILVCAFLSVSGCAGDDTETSAADGLPIDVVSSAEVQSDAMSAPDVSTTPDTAVPMDVPVVDMTEPDTSPPDAAEDIDGPDDTGPVDVMADVTADAGPADATEMEVAEPEDVGPGPDVGIAAKCFSEISDGEAGGPNYDKFEFTVGEHCLGTNHQDITGIKKVVILGDSVTVGTPNLEFLLSTDNAHFWRNKLAEWLTTEFNLDQGDVFSWGIWKTYDYFTGKGGSIESGDFKNCAKWGARNDDLIAGGGQIKECFPSYPELGNDQATLIVFTMGGNDVSKISQTGQDAPAEEVAADYPAAWKVATDASMFLEEAVIWLKDPVRFPGGSHVVFASPFEFTDSTGNTDACSVAALAGYGAWEKPEIQTEIVIWLLEEYMRIAAEHDVDLIWMLEHFCGHGFVATGEDADTDNRCYRGPDAALWFDDTCIHPNSTGHNAIFEMFKSVIEE
jgi:lysophospholipase L1-like esterase